MKRDPKMKICYDRIIPVGKKSSEATLDKMYEEVVLKVTGAKTPREAFRNIDPRVILPAPHLALITLKTWPTGSTLKCRFLDGTLIQQSKVIPFAKIWEQYANIHIDFVTTKDEQIRISFKANSGSWSAIGKDALNITYFPKDQPTMNFGWLEDNTDGKEYKRVVMHEFGHALGCIHEHQQPNENLQWNKEAVYAQFSGPPNNWSKSEIDSNILQKYSQEGINATIFDNKSIMLYQFPAELFLNHIGTPENFELSEIDKAFMATIYKSFEYASLEVKPKT